VDFESGLSVMIFIKLFLTFVLPFSMWLLMGGPGPETAGSLIIFVFLSLHLLVVIWNRATFKLFGGDDFTYGMVTMAINLLSFIYSSIIGLCIFYFYGLAIPNFSSIPKYLWGVLALGLIGNFVIQMLTTKHVDPLPDRDERREFEKPRMD
jgi:hypothetical protein